MLSQLVVATMLSTAWGLSSPHRVEFLSTDAAPSDEAMGPNMNFAPLSTTMQCTINLTLQYIVIFTALGVCRTYLDFMAQDHEKSEVQKALKHAAETVFYAPMACLMFVGFRMRVLQLTKGQGNPQEWVQFAMQSVAYSILANTVLVLCVPIFTSKEVAIDKETGDLELDQPSPFENKMVAMLLTGVRYAAFLGLYVGFGAVCVGLYMFEPPAGTWQGEVPSVSPAVGCTCILANTFFGVYFLAAASRTYSQFNPQAASEGHGGRTHFENVMLRAADTLGMAPMLCVIFLAARMRALQMDPLTGNPQSWAQDCFYACTYALVAQCLVAVAIPLVIGGKPVPTKIEGDVVYEEVGGGNWVLVKCLTVFRYVIMLSIYAAVVAVVCSVFTIEHPQGKEFTPAISPTMLCVINLAFQYFLIYLLLWIVYTCEDFWGSEFQALKVAKEAVESAKATVQFAPMLSVLFVATRMRALQITDNRGAPQGYAQSGMYLASWAVLIQFLMCLVLPIFTGKAYHTDTLDKPCADKSTEDLGVCGFKIPFTAVAITIVRYLALISLLGGVTAVITGVVLMTPENANGRGSLPLVGDYVPAPTSPTDVAGVKGAMESTGHTIGDGVHGVNSATSSATQVVTGF